MFAQKLRGIPNVTPSDLGLYKPSVDKRQLPPSRQWHFVASVAGAAAGNAVLPAGVIDLELVTDIVITRIAFATWRTAAGASQYTGGQIILTSNNLVNQEPQAVTYAPAYGSLPGTMNFNFTPSNNSMEFPDDTGYYVPKGSYDLQVQALGTFLAGDNVDFDVTIHYKVLPNN